MGDILIVDDERDIRELSVGYSGRRRVSRRDWRDLGRVHGAGHERTTRADDP